MLNVEAVNATAGFETIDDYLFRFLLSPFGMVLSVVVSILTVYLSAYLPARKAALVPAINAIRGIGEVKISKKRIRGGRVVKKIFKTEGMLARIFMKRNKKNFRATVIAVSFSVAIFIVAGSIHTQITNFALIQWGGIEADVRLSLQKKSTIIVDCDDFDENHPGFFYNIVIDSDGNHGKVCFMDLPIEQRAVDTESFMQGHDLIEGLLSENDRVFGIVDIFSPRLITRIPKSEFTSDALRIGSMNQQPGLTTEDYFDLHLSFIAVDPLFYNELARIAGVPEGSNILMNHGREWTNDNRLVDIEMLNRNITEINLYEWNEDWTQLFATGEMLQIHGMISNNDIPSLIHTGSTNVLTVVVPLADNLIRSVDWLIQTDEPARIHLESQEVLFGLFEDNTINLWSLNLRSAADETRDTLGLILFFLSSFVAVLILIALTNVISTISENVKTRKKEFAVLQSVGMTNSGIKRMLNLESVFASIHSLFIGIPLGVLGSFGVFHAMGNVGAFRFQFPWVWIVVSVIGVFLITWMTMQFAANKLKEQNIIETIRNGSGM